MDKDLILSEYKKRINKTKEENELELVKLNETKELSEKIFKKYKDKEKECEELNEKIAESKESITKLQKNREVEEKKLMELQNDIIKSEEEILTIQDKRIKEERKLLDLKNHSFKNLDYILQMNDDSFEVASKRDISIIDDMDIINKMNGSKLIALAQIHFEGINDKKYKELSSRDWNPFTDLIDGNSHIDFRIYDEKQNKFVQLEMKISKEELMKCKNLYDKQNSFWLEPTGGDGGKYSYMALIWNNV